MFIEENRIETEREYLALLINKPDLLSIVQIKEEYLSDSKNKMIFQHIKECFDEHECLNIIEIYKKHKNFDVEYFIDLAENTFFCKQAWKSQLELSEQSIIKFYKEDVIKRLNERREKCLCDYDEYVRQIKKLDDIVLTEHSLTLTKKEIIESINEETSRIQLNKFPTLNKMLNLVQGDFLIIGAQTGKGKSSFLLNLMNNLMDNFQCIYFNMEMSKSTIYKRMISINAEMMIDDVKNPKTDYQNEIIDKTMQRIEKNNLIVEHKANDIKQIKTILMKTKDKNRHTIVFVDHLGLTRIDSQKNLYEQVTEVAKALRQMCLEYDCTIIGASQLNRTSYNSTDLSLSMLKDSGELENSASKVILLKKSNEKDKSAIIKMEIKVVKNRDGICGDIEMKYDKTKQIFEEVKG